MWAPCGLPPTLRDQGFSRLSRTSRLERGQSDSPPGIWSWNVERPKRRRGRQGEAWGGTGSHRHGEGRSPLACQPHRWVCRDPSFRAEPAPTDCALMGQLLLGWWSVCSLTMNLLSTAASVGFWPWQPSNSGHQMPPVSGSLLAGDTPGSARLWSCSPTFLREEAAGLSPGHAILL